MSGLRLAASSTRLGQLQRGRGAGWLAAAETRGVDLLVQCLDADPRYDSQAESRAEFYATLAIELGLPAQELALGAITDEYTRELRLAVLAIMAKRGNAAALEVLRDHLNGSHGSSHVAEHLLEIEGDHEGLAALIVTRMGGSALDEMVFCNGQFPWERWAVRHPEIADAMIRVAGWGKRRAPPPALDAPLEVILAADFPSIPQAILRRLADCPTAKELGRLQQAAVGDDLTARRFALHVLGERNDPCALGLAASTFAANAKGRERASLYRYIRALDASHTLPLARRWLGIDDSRSGIAACLMSLHSEAVDVPAIRAAFGREWSDEECSYELCDLIVALGRHPEQGPYEELRRAFTDVVYSYARKKAAVSMARVDPCFQDLFAYECLWDCEPDTQIIALEAADLTRPQVAVRVHHLAQHGANEEDRVKEVAEARLAAT